jgi:hypothetical protein
MPLTYEQLLETAQRLKGRVLTTVTGREFTVGIYMDCPYFIPLSTGQGRSGGRKGVERFVERFNETGSPRPADYKDVTRDATYLVVLAEIAISSAGF